MNFLILKEVHKALDIQENDMAIDLETKELLDDVQEHNVCLYNRYKHNVVVVSGMSWYTRLWYLISNPFRYLFTGVWKF